MKEDEASLPDHLRCNRSDGRKWRCTRRALDEKKLCEIHHLQLQHRQHKEKVPESLKLQRNQKQKRTASRDLGNRAKIKTRVERGHSVGVSEALDDALKRMKLKKGDLQLDLIRTFLQRQAERRKSIELQEASSEGELTRDLPNGLMAIALTPLPQHTASDAISCDIKLGIDTAAPSCPLTRRSFRSKIIEPRPVGTMQIVPNMKNAQKSRKNQRNKCHRCQKSVRQNLIKCLNCNKEVFCQGCIKQRYLGTEDEARQACPVCRGSCSCRTCLMTQSTGVEYKDFLIEKDKIYRILHFHYLICKLLPVLKRINEEYATELGIDSKMKGYEDLERSAEEIICSYDFPDSSESSPLSCSFCIKTSGKYANREEDPNDNFLFCPCADDINNDNLEHFQKHWMKGHPVIINSVIPSLSSDLSWDPIFIFCTYLEKIIAGSVNDFQRLEQNGLDWCEVEIGIRNIFSGSLGEPMHAHAKHETLKLKGWLSFHLFRQHFPSHYAQILRSLPLQEYLNSESGLLNLTSNFPKGVPTYESGSCIHISYGSSEEYMQSDSVTKLCYDSNDMVNILAHSAHVPLSKSQFSRLKKLFKQYQSRGKKQTSRITRSLNKRRNGSNQNSPLQFQGEYDSDFECSSDEEEAHFGNSQWFGKRSVGDACSAQWDVFRRQDVPKLLEFLKRHSNEFTHTYGFPKHVVHPILDKIFFLDSTDKMRLKEEFKIEPWTFQQRLGEAVIIPAGCPYQIKNLKSCINVVLEFISPENVTNCIELMDELQLLPDHHNAKKRYFEIKKLVVYSIDAAIKEIRKLTSVQ